MSRAKVLSVGLVVVLLLAAVSVMADDQGKPPGKKPVVPPQVINPPAPSTFVPRRSFRQPVV